MGMVNVTPKVLTFTDLGISGVTKVYDGSINMTNLVLSTSANAFVPGDVVRAVATGTFGTQNVGTGLDYTVGINFSGADAANYSVTGGAVYVASGNGTGLGVNGPGNGSITQLASVTYTGLNGGNWSNPANWTTTGTTAVGAVPTQSPYGSMTGTPNVANVIIPVGSSVIYDAAVGMPVTSSVLDNGNLTFNLPSATSIAMPISGTGVVTIANTAPLTLTGSNNYSGGTVLNAGSILLLDQPVPFLVA
jgi:autotransporter-associated beta strand protein